MTLRVLLIGAGGVFPCMAGTTRENRRAGKLPGKRKPAVRRVFLEALDPGLRRGDILAKPLASSASGPESHLILPSL